MKKKALVWMKLPMTASFIRLAAGMLLAAALWLAVPPVTAYAAVSTEYFREVFDADYYYNHNEDLQAAIGADAEALFHHFITTGVREGRSGNEEFNLRAYVFHNPDLVGSYQTDLAAYCKHYVQLGKAEGRICLPQEGDGNLVGTYTTEYDPSLPRATNIAIASERVNGTRLAPGELFSFDQTVLSRRPENGYVMAPAIGRMEYGGGICQVSSTLYAAMCHALISATERYPHSARVHYLPAGLDATISEGRKDLKFINPYDMPLEISVEANEGALTVSLFRGETERGEDQAAEVTEETGGTETKFEPEAEAKTEAGFETEAETESGAEAEPEAEAETETGSEAEVESETETEAETEAEQPEESSPEETTSRVILVGEASEKTEE